ncbi:hypothetical protein SCUCBS95973_006000 [Sporothrix curviconia]|uniref:Nicotinamide-nucleotide adenylyltransferase n=1 Tax=Sporothrix curviconia TaxID=1260050 RepID=A0ABP0C3M2_9PEZI
MPRPSGPPDAADTMVAAEVAFFTKALAGFAKSKAKFEVRSMIHDLVILDSSFNPPTLAHMRMATAALQFLRSNPLPTYRSTRLLLLLSVNNADKAPKPAAFEERLALMLAMARDTHAVLASSASEGPDAFDIDIPIDIGLTSEPYFHSKSNAIAASPFYVRPDLSPSAVPGSKITPDQLFLIGYDTLIRIFDPKYYKAPADNDDHGDGAGASAAASLPEGLAATSTPMQVALTPLMRRARLRVTTRPDSDWGDEETQRRWVAEHVDALGGPTEHWASRISLDTGGAGTGASAVSSTVAREASRAHDTARLEKLVGPAVLSWLENRSPYGES